MPLQLPVPNRIVEEHLDELARRLEAVMEADVLAFIRRLRGQGGGPGHNLVRPFTRRLERTKTATPPLPQKRSRR